MAEEIEDLQEQAQEQEDRQPDEAVDQAGAEQEGPPAGEAGDGLPENSFAVEDAGTLKKKVTVTVPRERIDAKSDEMFGELGRTAQVPGFRIGRAPRRLLEKRFGKEVSQDVRNALLGDALGGTIDKTGLKTIGEPEIDLDDIELPEEGEMEFSFEVEVAPEFELPELKGIRVSRPTIEINDQRVDEYIDQLRQQRATTEKSKEPAREGDQVTAGAKITGEGIEEVDCPELELRVAPGQIEGIPLVDLGKELAGKKTGEVTGLLVTVPEAHPNEEWRGKELRIEITVRQVRRRIIPELDEDFIDALGLDSLEELRGFVRNRLEARVSSEVDRAMREQIQQHLLENTKFDLPEGVLGRHTERVLQRQHVELLYRGVPQEQIDERMVELRAAASERARRDLKLQFILGEICRLKEVEVSDDEVNARVAEVAATYGRRPEQVRQELDQDGSLAALQVTIAEEKVLDLLLADAEITEVAEQQAEGEPEKGTRREEAGQAGRSEDKGDEEK